MVKESCEFLKPLGGFTATPKVITDGVTSLNEAALNKFIAGNGTKVQIKMLYATIVYDSGSLVVQSTTDSCGIVTGDVAYDDTNDYAEITISGFTNPPFVQATDYFTDASYEVKALAVSNVLVRVAFYDPADGSRVTPGAEDANMNFHLLVIGY